MQNLSRLDEASDEDAGVLYPVWKIHLPPMFAGATMSLSSILVVCSSLHLKCFAPPKLPIVGGARSVVPL